MQKLNYNIIGQKPSLVFIAGFGGKCNMYKKNLEPFAKKYQIFIIDFSYPLKNKNLTLKNFAELLDSFFKEKDIKSPILIGHSFGAAIALAYGLYFKNYKKINALSPPGILPTSYPKMFLSLLTFSNKLSMPVGKKIASLFLGNIFSHPFWASKKLKLIKNLQFTKYQISKIKKLKIIFSDKDFLYPTKKLKKLPKSYKIKIIKGTHDWPLFEPQKLKETI